MALVTQEAFIFPSLGAMAFILFYVPLAQPASPCNTLCGHFIGAVMGLLVHAFIINRVAGLPYPLWSSRPVHGKLAAEPNAR